MPGYLDRAMEHKDPRYARIFEKLGYDTRRMKPEAGKAPQDSTTIEELRATYKDKFGKKAFHGWSADDIRAKLAADPDPSSDGGE